jgi:hypothetical protein
LVTEFAVFSVFVDGNQIGSQYEEDGFPRLGAS